MEVLGQILCTCLALIDTWAASIQGSVSGLGQVCLKYVCRKPYVNPAHICLSALREKLTQGLPCRPVSALYLLSGV